jgi:malate permease and related proteins
MILIVGAIIACTSLGVVSERWAGDTSRRASASILTLMLFVLVPFESFFNIARLHLTSSVGAGIGLAYVAMVIAGSSAWLIARRGFGLPSPSAATLVCTVIIANTAYLGLPLSSTLLGSGQLPAAVAYDTLVGGPILLFVGFGLGAAFGTRAGASARERSRAFLARNPPLLAVIAGLLAPSALAPQVLVQAAHVVVYALLVLGFYVLGVNLASAAEHGLLRLAPGQRAPLACAVALRMALLPAIIGICSLAVHLPRAYLLQAAMPSGINTLIIAHSYGLDLRLASTTIAWSTVVAVAVTIPAMILL